MILLCGNWTLFFVWNMGLHVAARDVRFPPLLVYVLRKDWFAVCCLEGRLRQTHASGKQTHARLRIPTYVYVR